MNKTFIGKHTLRKLISLLKIDLNKKINYEDQLTEEDVRQIWNDVTGKDIPNILCLQHHHDELYSKLDHTHTTYSDKNHNHDALYSKLNHNHSGVYSVYGHEHDNRYYTETEINNKLTSYVSSLPGSMTRIYFGDHNGIHDNINNAIPAVPYISHYIFLYGTMLLPQKEEFIVAFPLDYGKIIYIWNYMERKWIPFKSTT